MVRESEEIDLTLSSDDEDSSHDGNAAARPQLVTPIRCKSESETATANAAVNLRFDDEEEDGLKAAITGKPQYLLVFANTIPTHHLIFTFCWVLYTNLYNMNMIHRWKGIMESMDA